MSNANPYQNHYFKRLMNNNIKSDYRDFATLKDWEYTTRPSMFMESLDDNENRYDFVMITKLPHSDKPIRTFMSAQDIIDLDYLERIGALTH